MSEDNIIYNKELRLPQLLIKLQTTYTINTHETIKIAIEIIHHNSKRCTFFYCSGTNLRHYNSSQRYCTKC